MPPDRHNIRVAVDRRHCDTAKKNARDSNFADLQHARDREALGYRGALCAFLTAARNVYHSKPRADSPFHEVFGLTAGELINFELIESIE